MRAPLITCTAGCKIRLPPSTVGTPLRSASTQHDVGRLEVSMHDAGSVRLVERVGNLNPDRQRIFKRQGTLFQARRERGAIQVLHDEEVGACFAADVKERADVRVIQRGNRTRFTVEALACRRIAAHVRRKHFDGDDSRRILAADARAYKKEPPCLPGLRGSSSSAIRRISEERWNRLKPYARL
jgi:hypothetical protein